MKKNLTRGFTLIELLVVIAIIGLLSSVVLTNLSTSRDKAKRARIKSDLLQARTLMEMNATNGVYNPLDTNVDPTKTVYDNIYAQGGNLYQNNGIGGILSDSSDYCLMAIYDRTDGKSGWCVDSRGNSLEITNPFNTIILTRCNTNPPFTNFCK